MKASELAGILGKDTRFMDVSVDKDAYAKSISFRFLGDPYVAHWTGVGLNVRVVPRFQYLQGILFDIISRSSTFISDGREIPSGKYLVLEAINRGGTVDLTLEDSHGQITLIETKKGSKIHREVHGMFDAPEESQQT